MIKYVYSKKCKEVYKSEDRYLINPMEIDEVEEDIREVEVSEEVDDIINILLERVDFFANQAVDYKQLYSDIKHKIRKLAL